VRQHPQVLRRFSVMVIAAVTVAAAAAPPLRAQEVCERIECAGELFVSLDAEDFSAGEEEWENFGTLENFVEVGDPVLTEHEGVQAVSFNTISGLVDAYQSIEEAPEGLVGLNPTRSIEVWVFNEDIVNEETMVAWGKRGGPDGTNMSFNYGTRVEFGAVGNWGDSTDLGWNPVPEPGVWHHLVYTYDGEFTRVYADGVENNSRIPEGVIDTYGPSPITIASQIATDGLSLDGGSRVGALSIAVVRVHDEDLTPDQVLENYEIERERFFPPDEPDAPLFRRGDTDGNGTIEVTDPINNLSFQFLGTFVPGCLDALDWDDSGTLEVTDPIGNLTRQFLGGEPAAAPGSESCGPDPTEDELGCDTVPACE
jgi:hypothetical protein